MTPLTKVFYFVYTFSQPRAELDQPTALYCSSRAHTSREGRNRSATCEIDQLTALMFGYSSGSE